jgi:RHS repeat-associated protein
VVRRYFPGGFWFSGTNYFYQADHLGSVREVTTSNGTVVARFTYDPYGKRTQTFGSTSFVVDIGFTGHFHHGPSGLIFAPGRFYDPETGRWISRDPIQEQGGINLYAYCGGDPINQTDALGLNDVDVYIWEARRSRVGHAMITDAGTENSIFSPFPHAPGGQRARHGVNQPFNFKDTVKRKVGNQTRSSESTFRMMLNSRRN